jgi:CrcB protein
MGIDIKNNAFFLISLGAILGALFRWQIDEILIVNLIGCFLLGFFNSLDILRRYKLTLCVGLCGSMTTFSGWSSHLYKLLNQGLYKLFLINSISLVFIGILAIGLGHIFAKRLNA